MTQGTTIRRRAMIRVGSAAMLVGTSLVVNGAAPASAAFPGINGKLACASARDGNSEIYTFASNATETDVTRITNNPAFDGRPRYSPDGRKIAFESSRSGFTEIWTMNADGTNLMRLTFTGSPGHGNSAPNWSPGGDQIAYQSTRDGNFEIYKMDFDGSNDTRLTNSPVEDSLPAWAPDGSKIAFSSRQADPAADVMLMNPDGTGVVDLTNSPGEDSWPSWSPDSTQIVFHSRLDDPRGEEIYRINRDGTGRTRLTFNLIPGDANTSFDVFPAWSPDGNRIAWYSGRDGNQFQFYTMSAVDGSDIIKITNNAVTTTRCDWQPLCTIYGSGNVVGTAGDDIICGSDGPDSIIGNGGNDRILGLGDNDSLIGSAGTDAIFGGAGNDSLSGAGGTDILDGGIGADSCNGGRSATVRNCYP